MQLHKNKIVKFNLPSSKNKWRIGVIQEIIGKDLYNIKEVSGRLWSGVPKIYIKTISMNEVGKIQKAVGEEPNEQK